MQKIAHQLDEKIFADWTLGGRGLLKGEGVIENDGWRNLDINDDVDPADLGPAVERIVDENTEAMKPAE